MKYYPISERKKKTEEKYYNVPKAILFELNPLLQSLFHLHI